LISMAKLDLYRYSEIKMVIQSCYSLSFVYNLMSIYLRLSFFVGVKVERVCYVKIKQVLQLCYNLYFAQIFLYIMNIFGKSCLLMDKSY